MNYEFIYIYKCIQCALINRTLKVNGLKAHFVSHLKSDKYYFIGMTNSTYLTIRQVLIKKKI